MAGGVKGIPATRVEETSEDERKQRWSDIRWSDILSDKK
jgi:hypothetical protein